MATYNQPQRNIGNRIADMTSGPPADGGQTLNLSGSEALEFVLDKIAEALILSPLINTTAVEDNQKFIRNGQLQLGAGTGVLALYQKDIKGNSEDTGEVFTLDDGTTISEFQTLVDTITNFNTVVIDVSGTSDNIRISLLADGVPNGGVSITQIISGMNNPLNVSQFIPLSQQQSNVNIDKAEEFLDTNIFELLPTGDTRQERIIKFFQELNVLLPPELPQFDMNEDGMVDRTPAGNWTGQGEYTSDNSIVNEENRDDGFIHRIKSNADSTNEPLTIEDIYNTIRPYLDDILEEPISPEDERPEYQNQSSGYLQFRNLNQGIVIRNTNKELMDNLNPETRDYLTTGFTIGVWVKFLDKISEGTLFNFGNPLRGDDTAFGIRLETYVLNKDDLCPHTDYTTWEDAANDNGYAKDFFNLESTARFIRLIVEDNGILRDSHVGAPLLSNSANETIFGKLQGQIPLIGDSSDNSSRLLNSTFIPLDFQEWYFICASFNPTIDEDNSFTSGMIGNEMYWMNHVNPDSPDNFLANSGLGNKCKVEIISRTDLLKSKGFKI